MSEYEFEIQALIKVKMSGTDRDEARIKVIDNLEDYEHEMMKDCYVSDGRELK